MTPYSDSPTQHTEDLIRLSYFTDIAKAISRTQSLKETLDEVMYQIGEVFAPRNWSLLLRNPKSGDLTFSVVIGSQEVASRLRGVTVPRGRGIAGWIAEHGQPLIIEDVDADKRFDPSVDEKLNFKTHSIIGVPLKSGDRVFGVIELINKMDGEPFTALDLKLLSTIAEFTAIAVEKAYYMKALRKIATVDHLTGAYNRRSCARILDREISRCHRHATTLAALMIDIDHFKEINDTHGHATGDSVLASFAKLASDCIRKVDFLCRYGGDEFVIVLPDANKDTGNEVRDRIRDALGEHNQISEMPYSISIGTFSGCPDSAAELLDKVDAELYDAKERRNDSPAASVQVEENTERTIEEISEHISEFFDEDSAENTKNSE